MQKSLKITITMFICSLFIFGAVLLYTSGMLNSGGMIDQPEPTPNGVDNQVNNDISKIPEPTATKIPTPTPFDPSKYPGITDNQRYGEKLVDEGTKNILIIGTDNGIGQLYDTIMVFSIDEKNEKINIINFPRDIYIDYNEKIIHYMNEIKPGYFEQTWGENKINNAHSIGIDLKWNDKKGKFGSMWSINFLSDVMDEVFDIPIDEYVRVNPEAFVQIVDLFGGVWIDVKDDMYYPDVYQDLYIDISPGYQLLDGKNAEGFVRFRQGYDRELTTLYKKSDYYRKQNQLDFIEAFIEQHGTVEELTNNFDDLIEIIDENVSTSIKGDKVLDYFNIATEIITKKYIIDTPSVSTTPKNINGQSFVILK